MINREKGQKEEKEEEEVRKLFMGIMEGYKDSIISPLSDFNPVNEMDISEKGSSSSRKRARFEAPETERMQIQRGRREKMAENFSVLQSMVPSLFSISKPSREKIVTETINYIKSLEEEKERLEGVQKAILEKPMDIKPSLSGRNIYLKPSVTSSISHGVAFLGVQLPVKRGLLSKIFKIFEKHQAELLGANVFVNDLKMLTLMGTFMVGSDGGNIVQMMKQEILIL